MGYVLYITRADNWLEAKRHPISQSEWNAVLEEDTTLSVNTEGYYERKTNGGPERFHPIEWSESPDENCFWFVDGAVECKNPSEVWIAKMVQLSRKLAARVIGEEDETYE